MTDSASAQAGIPWEIAGDFRRQFAGGPLIRAEGLRLSSQAGVTVLFGASGSGKTTVLRCLAGLERPDAGRLTAGEEVWFDAERKLFVPPRQRRVGFVPQNYALFPHLTVTQNIAYGLSQIPAPQRAERVGEALHWLGLQGLEERLPRELSGGQQQRVALARALVCRPRFLLLDEPLSALDAPTRLRLRGELRQLLVKVAIPTLLVTHDLMEALTLGDQLAVMAGGTIVQQGPAQQVFSQPATLEVAGIFGFETILPGRIVQLAGGLATVRVGEKTLTALARDLPPETSAIYVCIRAEDLILTKDLNAQSSARNRLRATVQTLASEGPMTALELDCGFPLKATLTQQACQEMALRQGDLVLALLKTPNIHLIPRLK